MRTETVYDVLGRILEQRQAGASSGTIIESTPTDSASLIGRVNGVGRNLMWQVTLGALSGTVTSTIRLTRGIEVVDITATATDAAGLRTFTADLGTLAEGSWSYEVQVLRAGTLIGATTGTLTTSGPAPSRTVSNVVHSPTEAPPVATPITSIGAQYVGSSVTFRWAVPPDFRVEGRLEVLVSGTWQSYDALMVGDESNMQFEVSGLALANGTYTYRVTNHFGTREIGRAHV